MHEYKARWQRRQEALAELAKRDAERRAEAERRFRAGRRREAVRALLGIPGALLRGFVQVGREGLR